MKSITLILFLLASICSTAQQKIHFSDISLKTALSVAKDKNKNVFIDTYASYCKPCKVMEQEFKNPAVAGFFNKHFVNVRVNMEAEKAKDYELEYQIVFLPTMIFVTPEGSVLTKMERIVPANELLSIGKLFSNQPNSAPAVVHNAPPTVSTNPPPAIQKSNPKPPKIKEVKTQAVDIIVPAKKEPVIIAEDEAEGKILYVMGQDTDNLPPEILKEEAYFRMQLMDGSQSAAARKYLDTQEDWLSDENVMFIHDFLEDARSDEFEFLIANKAKFETVIGKDRIHQTINILVNKELERAYPLPNLERAISLYTIADRITPIKKAQAYHLNNLYDAGNKQAFNQLADGLDVENLENAKVIHRVSRERMMDSKSKKNLKQCLVLADKSIALSPDNSLYHFNRANVAMLLRDRKMALESANKALALSKIKEEDKTKILKLLEEIELL